MEEVRLNQYLARCGVCSRRGADKLVEEGRITVNGRAASLGLHVSEADEVLVDGKAVSPVRRELILAVNKPIGVVCTEAHFKGEKTLSQMVDAGTRVFSIGRLDKDSEGLILMTNDGALAQEVSSSRSAHEKEYEVTADRPVTADFIERMRAGVDIGDAVTRPCKIRKTGPYSFNIILTQGLNRQIRRMCEALGYRVRSLKRIRVMNVKLGELEAGRWRELTAEEASELKRQLQ